MGATSAPVRDGEGGLLALALSRPNEAMERARALLAGRPEPLDASIAHQAIGLVLREFGDIDAAIAELRTALALARRSGAPERQADVLGTLGVALIFAGRTRAGRNALNASVDASSGLLRGRALLRRGACLVFLDLHKAAREDLNSAIAMLQTADDQIWEARALVQRAQSALALGSVRAAPTADLQRAEMLYTANGQELETADTVMLRGLVSFRFGDLPPALACFDQAADRYAALGVSEPDLTVYRCAVLSAAGLAADALREADTALGQLAEIGGRPTKRADLLLVAAEGALAARDAAVAVDRASEAARLFGRQGRSWWRAQARLARVRAAVVAAGLDRPGASPRAALGAPLLRDARRCVCDLLELGAPELPLAQLTAGRVALALARAETDSRFTARAPAGARASAHTTATAPARPATSGPTLVSARVGPGRRRVRNQPQPRPAEPGALLDPTMAGHGRASSANRPDSLRAEADELLAAAAAGRGRGPALSRAVAWLAQARRAEAAGDTRRLMHACRRGLAIIDDYRRVLGSTELRAQSTAHGAELAALGQHHAAKLGRPWLMLEWSERWRAVALAVPAVRPPDDELLQADLAALRDVASRLARAADQGQPTGPLEQERQRLERAVRARSLHATADRPGRTGRPGDHARTGRDPVDGGPGERPPGDRGPSERGPGERGPGERGPGERGPGDRGLSERGSGERGPGERGLSERGPGERGPGERGPDERGPDERAAPGRQPIDVGFADHGLVGADCPGGQVAAGQRGPLPVCGARGRAAGDERAFRVRRLLDALGDDTLVELVDVGGELQALVCGGGRVRRVVVGPAEQATRAVRFARLALRRAAHGPPVSPSDAVVHDWLGAMGEQLDRTLLGAAGELLGEGNLVVVPPGRLHAVPWGLLPRLQARAVSVAPSAAFWLRARQPVVGGSGEADPATDAEPGPWGAGQAASAEGRVVLVRGPGMGSGGAEVPRLAAVYAGAGGAPGATASVGGPVLPEAGPVFPPKGPVVLGEGTATVAAVLRAIDGAGLAHIAAHGTFRADSPLFSSLRLDDGQLTVYDLERLRRGPRRLVLSSCDSGVAAPTGADEVLGLASSLIPLGTTGIVASVVPVNDEAVVPLMIALHRRLRAGASLAQALRDARSGREAGPVAAATGWSFICLGS